MRSSPGEVTDTPNAIVKASTKKFQQLALPIAAFASFVIPFFANAVQAEETTAPAPAVEAKAVLGPAPTDFGMNFKDFYGDATKVRASQQPLLYMSSLVSLYILYILL